MNIALIGSGGREHALCQKLLESRKIKKIYCIPGNGGTSDIAINLNIDFLNFNLLYKTQNLNFFQRIGGIEDTRHMSILNF